MASAVGVAGVRATLDLGSKSSKCVQCGEPDSARITHYPDTIPHSALRRPRATHSQSRCRLIGRNRTYTVDVAFRRETCVPPLHAGRFLLLEDRYLIAQPVRSFPGTNVL